MLGFFPMFEVFSGLPTSLTYIIFGTANRPNIDKWPGAKFGKISLNYLDLWHFSRPYERPWKALMGLNSSLNLVDVSDFFNFFAARRRGRGPKAAERGGRGQFFFFFIENPRRGGLLGERRRGGGEGPGGCLRGIWGGGAKFPFFGAEMPTKSY